MTPGEPTTAAPASRRARVVIALVGVALLAAYAAPIDMLPDSLHYLDMARTIARDGQIASYHLNVNSTRIPDPNLAWPPGYPLALAALMKLGLGDHAAAYLLTVGSLSFCLVVLLSLLRRPEWMVLAALAWLQTTNYSWVSRYALSEAPFVALVLGSLWCLAQSAGRRWPLALLLGLAAGTLGGAAELTRYAGVFLAPTLLLVGVLLVRHRREHRFATVVAGLAAAVTMAAVFAWWCHRNQILSGMPLGPARPPSDFSLLAIAWHLLSDAAGELPGLLPLLAVGLAAPLLPAAETGAGGSVRRGLLLGCVVWAAVHALGLIQQATSTRMDSLMFRIMFPTYGVLAMALALWLDDRRGLPARGQRALLILGAVLVPLLLVPGLRGARPGVPDVRGGLYEWIARATPPDALFVGREIWGVRTCTGRVVLESGVWREGNDTADGAKVRRFLDRFSGRFSQVYLLSPAADLDAIRASYGQAGLRLAPVPGAPADQLQVSRVLP